MLGKLHSLSSLSNSFARATDLTKMTTCCDVQNVSCAENTEADLVKVQRVEQVVEFAVSSPSHPV